VRTGGEWVVAALHAEGVRHVFGIPGVHNLAVYDALIRQTDVTHVLARHEAGAAFMADGYARASGLPGVVVVTTGPSATNVLTPLVESYAGSIPVLVVMSDVASPLVGRDIGALHEVPNQIDCFKPVTRWAEAVTEASAIPTTVHGAFDLLRTGRPGPIAISIPNDFLTARFDTPPRTGGHGRRPPCHVDEIREATRLLAGASKPLIISGGGVIAAGAEAELVGLTRRLGAPVITTVMGRGAISERDPLWHGVLPNGRATDAVIRAADVILAVGCRFAHRSTQGLLLNLSFSAAQTLIHLDLDPTVLGRLFKPQLGIVGDARDGLMRMLESLGPGRPRDSWDHAWRAGLRGAANDWMEWRFPVLLPRTFLYPVGSAALGYGVPAAIGAKIARPDRPVICVVGDGGFMYSVNELATAVKYRLPVVFLVMNDERYGAIKWLQQTLFEGRWGEADLVNPDFPALARAFGARGERVNGVESLGAAIKSALAAGGPTVLELPMAIDPPWEL
jgi:thiamine pyrophosphate-dependent acetolactate synthase large subunit-like protein